MTCGLKLRWQDLAALLALVGMLLFVDGRVTGWGFFSDDDPIILAYAMTHSPLAYFFDPQSWRELTTANLTPWLVLDFDVDHALFGLNAAGYYGHVLLTLALCAGLLYVILQRFTSRPWAFAGAALFILSPPTVILAHQLMSRHYVSGLMFSLVSLFFFLEALDCTEARQGRIRAGLGAGAYLLALSSKEVFALLPLILLALPRGRVLSRMRGLLPYGIGALIYLFWRRWMLGEWVGGYGAAGPVSMAPVLHHFGQLPRALSGGDTRASLIVGFALLALAGALYLRPNRLPLLLAALTAVLLPLVPVHEGLLGTPRYQFVPALLCVVMVVLSLDTISKGKPILRGLAWLFVLMLGLRCDLLAHQSVIDAAQQAHRALTLEQPLWSGDATQLVWLPEEVPYQQVKGIQEIRESVHPGQGGPQFIYDEIQLTHLRHPFQTVWRYDETQKGYVDYGKQLPGAIAAWHESLRQAPFSLGIGHDAASNFLNWRVGPPRQGRYELISVGGSKVPISAVGAARVHIANPDFYIRYNAPEGWVSYTDLLTLPKNGTLYWERMRSDP